MISVTEQAATELQALRTANNISPDQGVKLVPDMQGGIGMTLGEPEPGDTVINDGDTTVLIVDQRLAEHLDGVVIDCDSTASVDGQSNIQFVLRRGTEEPRTEH